MNKTKLVMAGMVTLLCLLPVITKIVMTVVYQLQHHSTKQKAEISLVNDALVIYPEVAPMLTSY